MSSEDCVSGSVRFITARPRCCLIFDHMNEEAKKILSSWPRFFLFLTQHAWSINWSRDERMTTDHDHMNSNKSTRPTLSLFLYSIDHKAKENSSQTTLSKPTTHIFPPIGAFEYSHQATQGQEQQRTASVTLVLLSIVVLSHHYGHVCSLI